MSALVTDSMYSTVEPSSSVLSAASLTTITSSGARYHSSSRRHLRRLAGATGSSRFSPPQHPTDRLVSALLRVSAGCVPTAPPETSPPRSIAASLCSFGSVRRPGSGAALALAELSVDISAYWR